MPLSKLQSAIFRVLAAHRDPESYIAGSTWLTRRGTRFSGDIDIFHDREDRVARAAEEDAATLTAEGLSVQWMRREPLFYQASVAAAGDTTRLEWVVDSDFRFFPAQRDPEFGYVLHPADLATNKIMAAAGRREPRDIVDLIDIHETILPLGAVAWAAVGRSLGFTPEGLINEVRRLARYRDEDFRRVASEPPVDAGAAHADGQGWAAFSEGRTGGSARSRASCRLCDTCGGTTRALAFVVGDRSCNAGTLW